MGENLGINVSKMFKCTYKCILYYDGKTYSTMVDYTHIYIYTVFSFFLVSLVKVILDSRNKIGFYKSE